MATNNPFAVVTGASSGIGFELARQFARAGFDLIIVAEDASIVAAARQLTAEGAEVDPVQIDLTTRTGPDELFARVQATGRPLNAVALNAGVGLGGAFVDTDLDAELAMIDLNVKSTVHLAKRVLREMVPRNQGKVLITSSIASTMPGPYMAVYNATKSFLQSFAQALQTELTDTGVTVTSLMPGPTDTAFFERAEMQDTALGQGTKDDPVQVAEQGFRAMMAGDDKILAGSAKTKLMGAANAVLPDKLKSSANAQLAEPGSGESG